jgi:hypothetical protein
VHFFLNGYQFTQNFVLDLHAYFRFQGLQFLFLKLGGIVSEILYFFTLAGEIVLHLCGFVPEPLGFNFKDSR